MTWTQTDKLKKLNLKLCSIHGKLFSAKEGAQCKKCAETVPQKVCKRGHSRNEDVKRCGQCDKDRRLEKLEIVRSKNAEATVAREARRAGLGVGVNT